MMATGDLAAVQTADGGERDGEVLRLLARHPIRPYLLDCRRNGRAHADPAVRATLLALLDALPATIPADPGCGAAKARTLALRFLGIERAIDRGELHYAHYLNLAVIEDYLAAGAGIDRRLARTRLMQSVLVTSWLEEERFALERADRGSPPFAFVRDSVATRVDRLRDIAFFVDSAGVPFSLPRLDRWRPRGIDWLDLATTGDGLLGTVLLTAMPQSRYHDETMFVRITQLAECCFAAAAEAILAACASPRDPMRALGLIKEAGYHVALLLKLFTGVFRTLPKENFFTGFRPETGGSSALQSYNYQRLDRMIRGFGADKIAALADQPLVNTLAVPGTTPSRCLRELHDAAQDSAVWTQDQRSRLTYHLEQIGHAFLAWRSFHLGIARDYLPAEAHGTGGMGIAYLERTLDCPCEALDADAAAAGVQTLPATPNIAYWLVIPAGDADDGARTAAVVAERLAREGLAVSIHRHARVSGLPWLDAAVAGEFFTNQRQEHQRCRAGDMVLRDRKGIVATASGGASVRTGAVPVAGPPVRAGFAVALLPAWRGIAPVDPTGVRTLAAAAGCDDVTVHCLSLGERR